MNKHRSEGTESPLLPATASGKGLANFPLKSPQSRAAARALVEERKVNEEGLYFVSKCIVHDSIIDLSGVGCKRCALSSPPFIEESL